MLEPCFIHLFENDTVKMNMAEYILFDMQRKLLNIECLCMQNLHLFKSEIGGYAKNRYPAVEFRLS